MATIHPRRIQGAWLKGIALDVHTVSSVHVGQDESGRSKFETTRSELGELMYRLKYQQDKRAAAEIVETVAQYLQPYLKNFELIVPVPPSTTRNFQPVLVLARGIAAAVECPVFDCIDKARATPGLKDVLEPEKRKELLTGLYSVDPKAIEGRHVLLIDDLYRSGSTMSAATEALLSQGKAASVRALAITYTRTHS